MFDDFEMFDMYEGVFGLWRRMWWSFLLWMVRSGWDGSLLGWGYFVGFFVCCWVGCFSVGGVLWW